MINLPRLLIFLHLFFLINGVTVTVVLAQSDFLYHVCNNDDGNYTSNSTYKANLDILLSSIPSDNAIDYGFYNFSAGHDTEKVNAIGLCRGDVRPDACRSCLNDSRIQFAQLCPNQKAAIGWYDNCMLRYSSNASIFGTAEISPAFYMRNQENTSNVKEFNQVLGQLMGSLRSKAAAGDWRRKFGTGQANVTSLESIYGLMQCTPDLSESSCSNCLEGATNSIPSCCDGKKGGRVVRPSCNVRFETYRFYESTAGNAPPPAVTPTSSPSPRSADPPLPPPPAATPTSSDSPPSADLAPPPPLTNSSSTQGTYPRDLSSFYIGKKEKL